MKIFKILPVFLVIISVALAGCTGDSQATPTTGGGEQSSDIYEDLTFTASELKQHYRSDGSCYRVTTVDVRNNGNTNAENVMIRCKLVDPVTGTVSDTKSKFFEVIAAGDHEAFTIELNGECDKDYSLDVTISRDER